MFQFFSPGFLTFLGCIKIEPKAKVRESCKMGEFTNTGQNVPTFIDPSIWNKLLEVLKKSNNINTFKHNLKRCYLTRLK